jgi:hypothetical protein
MFCCYVCCPTFLVLFPYVLLDWFRVSGARSALRKMVSVSLALAGPLAPSSSDNPYATCL